ncbi:MAG: hypothetical protein ACM3SO_02945 [Betaproteobacteria bacterium]
MTPALAFLGFAAAAFSAWMVTGSRWLIWLFVIVTLVLAIDATHGGLATSPILPTASNDGG